MIYSKRGMARLEKLANFLLIVHPSKFNLKEWVRGTNPRMMSAEPAAIGTCNTTACAIGWLPKLFPRSWGWIRMSDGWMSQYMHRNNSIVEAAHFFGISYEESVRLFTLEGYRSNNPRPKTVARRIFGLIQVVRDG